MLKLFDYQPEVCGLDSQLHQATTVGSLSKTLNPQLLSCI